MNLLAKLRSLLPSKPEQRVVLLNEEGFSVSAGEKVAVQILWADVVEIVAFKRDLFAIDEICLGFRQKGGAHVFLWAGDQDAGFENLQPEIEKKFSGIRTDWFRDVAVPAFRVNWTSLWRIVDTPEEKKKQPNQAPDPTRFTGGSS